MVKYFYVIGNHQPCKNKNLINDYFERESFGYLFDNGKWFILYFPYFEKDKPIEKRNPDLGNFGDTMEELYRCYDPDKVVFKECSFINIQTIDIISKYEGKIAEGIRILNNGYIYLHHKYIYKKDNLKYKNLFYFYRDEDSKFAATYPTKYQNLDELDRYIYYNNFKDDIKIMINGHEINLDTMDLINDNKNDTNERINSLEERIKILETIFNNEKK